MSNTIKELKENSNFNRTRIWAKKRGIIVKGNEETQVFKLIEEFGELVAGVLKQKEELIVDSIGDMIVVLTNLNKVKGFDLEHGLNKKEYYEPKNQRECLVELNETINNLLKHKDSVTLVIDYSNDIINTLTFICAYSNISISDCFNFAYNEIKNRTGKNVNGNFIKDEN